MGCTEVEWQRNLDSKTPGQEFAGFRVLHWLQERLPDRQLLIVVGGLTVHVSTDPQLGREGGGERAP